MDDAVYNQIVAKISAPDDSFYKYIAEENIFPGWKIINGIEEEKFYKFLSNFKNGNISYKKILSKESLKDLKLHYTEAKLVQLLEQKGIGRPSTFSTLIEKIQERDYVKKQDVKGKKINIKDYILEDGEITEELSEKEFGNENKLVITQTGIFVIEFLIKYFDELFDFDYTKNMEDKLDIIAKGNKYYYELCEECNSFITNLIKTNSLSNEKNIEKINIKIDNKHTYLIGKNGPTVKFSKEDGTFGFYSVKSDINIDFLRRKNIN